MANISRYLQTGENIDHTPAADVAAGNIIQVGNLSAFSSHDIATGALGAVAVSGVIRAPYVGGAADVGDNVWWDANGTPYGGDADGAMTTNGAAGDWWVGTLVAPAAATDATCDIALNVENPNLPAWQGKTHIAVDDNTTLTAADHSGSVVHVTAADKTITLPTGVAGMDFIVQNDVADAGSELVVDLDGNEIIEGGNLSVAATKTANLTKATSKRGDYLHLVCNVDATSWRCVARRGIWAETAS